MPEEMIPARKSKVSGITWKRYEAYLAEIAREKAEAKKRSVA
jgi:hypothetical protein